MNFLNKVNGDARDVFPIFKNYSGKMESMVTDITNYKDKVFVQDVCACPYCGSTNAEVYDRTPLGLGVAHFVRGESTCTRCERLFYWITAYPTQLAYFTSPKFISSILVKPIQDLKLSQVLSLIDFNSMHEEGIPYGAMKTFDVTVGESIITGPINEPEEESLYDRSDEKTVNEYVTELGADEVIFPHGLSLQEYADLCAKREAIKDDTPKTPKQVTGVFEEFEKENGDCRSFLSADEPVSINASGGKQSDIGVRMDLIPSSAIIEVGNVLAKGVNRYGIDNWRNIGCESHLNHAIKHAFQFLDFNRQFNDEGEYTTYVKEAIEELSHCSTRVLFALEQLKQGVFDCDCE